VDTEGVSESMVYLYTSGVEEHWLSQYVRHSLVLGNGTAGFVVAGFVVAGFVVAGVVAGAGFVEAGTLALKLSILRMLM